MAEIAGYVWQQPEQVNPAVVAVMDQVVARMTKLWRSCHPYWVIDCVYDEGGLFRVPKQSRGWQPRPANTLHLYTPQTVYWEDERPMASDRLRSSFVLFRGGQDTPLAGLLSCTPGYLEIEDPKRIAIGCVEQIARATQRKGESALVEAQWGLWQVIGHIVEANPIGQHRYAIGKDAEHQATDGFAEQVNRYLEKHLQKRLTLKGVAKGLSISVSTLSHRYQQQTGQSPMLTLNTLRVEYAKAMLLKGYQLQMIAEQTGFLDAFQLSRVFKRIEGCSPKAYRDDYPGKPRRGVDIKAALVEAQRDGV